MQKTREALIETARAVRRQKLRGNIDRRYLPRAGTKGGCFITSRQTRLFMEVWTRLQVSMDAEAREAAIAASLTDPYSAFWRGAEPISSSPRAGLSKSC